MSNKKTVALSLKKTLIELIEKEAKKENRSVSNFVETILIYHFDKINSNQ